MGVWTHRWGSLSLPRSGFVGAALVLSPLAFIFLVSDLSQGVLPAWRLACAWGSLLLTVAMLLVWKRSPRWGQALALFYRWSQNFISPLPRIVVGGGALALVGGLVGGGDFAVCALVLTFFFDFFLLDSYGQLSWREDLGVEFFLNHPGRVVIATFVILCGVGSILLYLPFSTKEPVDFLDAAFSAVSSVCVTGLSILDVERDFTPWGRFFLALLMQLGGLGMMSLSALVMHVLGRRMSLRHERLAVSAAGSSGMGEDWWTASLCPLPPSVMWAWPLIAVTSWSLPTSRPSSTPWP